MLTRSLLLRKNKKPRDVNLSVLLNVNSLNYLRFLETAIPPQAASARTADVTMNASTVVAAESSVGGFVSGAGVVASATVVTVAVVSVGVAAVVSAGAAPAAASSTILWKYE